MSDDPLDNVDLEILMQAWRALARRENELARAEEREEKPAPELREEPREPGPGVEIEIPPEHAGVLRGE